MNFRLNSSLTKTLGSVAVIGSKGFPRFDDAGGVEQGVLEVTTRLSKRGYKPIVYQRGEKFSAYDEHGVRLQTVPFIDSQSLSGWSHAFLSFFHALFATKNVSVYHVHCAQNGFICLVARLTGKRVVFHLHGREWRVKKWGWLMQRLIFLNCIIGTLSSHSTIAVCQTSMKDLNRWLPFCRRKMRFIPNGVPKALENADTKAIPYLEPGRPFILYAGRLVPQKNLSVLLKAFLELPHDVSLVIAGGASYCSSYVSSIKEASVNDDRVRLVGRLDRLELWNLYQSCTALVLPSAAEGCSNVLLEGLAAGCCIVASDIPENQFVLGDAALYFKANDEQSLTEVLSFVCKEPGSLDRVRSATLKRRQQLPCWDATTDDIIKLYEA